MTGSVRRFISYFDKRTELIAGEIPLVDPSPDWIRELFGLPPDDPAYDCYPVNVDNLQFVATKIADGALINLDAYDYFIDCESR